MSAPTWPAWVELRRRPLTVQERGGWTYAPAITTPAGVARLLRPLADVETVEVFWLMCLDAQHKPTGITEITRGILTGSLVHPREVFRVAIVHNASSVIVAHNHPSGCTTPSAEDRAVTAQLVKAGQLLDVPVLDHLIMGDGREFFSFQESGLM